MIGRVPSLRPTTEAAWNYERYLRETRPGEYFTIIAGEKIMSPSPTDFHQVVLGNLYMLLRAWARQTQKGKVQLAPFDVVLSETEIVQPDIIFASTEHRERFTPKNFHGAPDLVIEILSPGSMRIDRVIKRALYAHFQVPEYWIISPGDRTVEVLRLREGQYAEELYEEDAAIQSAVLPGFTCTVTDIFAD